MEETEVWWNVSDGNNKHQSSAKNKLNIKKKWFTDKERSKTADIC